MKNPLQNLLIVLALALCGLCSWQWYSQVEQRKEMTALCQTNYDQSVAIQGYTNSLAILDHQVAQMDGRITELRATIQSNHVASSGFREENLRLVNEFWPAAAEVWARLFAGDEWDRTGSGDDVH